MTARQMAHGWFATFLTDTLLKIVPCLWKAMLRTISKKKAELCAMTADLQDVLLFEKTPCNFKRGSWGLYVHRVTPEGHTRNC